MRYRVLVFQFLLVRLRGAGGGAALAPLLRISIPSGAIKRIRVLTGYQYTVTFQFLLVRLRDLHVSNVCMT